MNSSSSNHDQNNDNHHNANPLQKKKSTSGRRKLPMEKIKNETSRQVTFSKRKGGLVKKASELSTLTGIEIALAVFSPAGKVYSYGNPSLERVTSRWMYANAYAHDECAPGSVMQAAILSRQNEEITKSETKLAAQRNQRRELMSMEAACLLSGTYPSNLKTLRYDEVCSLIASIRGFESSLEAKVKEANKDDIDPKSLKAPQHYLHERGQCSFSSFIGSSSSSRVVQQNQMVQDVFRNNVINDSAYPNQRMYTQQRDQCFSNVVGGSSSHVVQRNQMVPEVFNSNTISDNVSPNQGMMYTQRRGQCFSNVIGSSSSQIVQRNQVQDCNKTARDVFINNNNRVNDNVNPNNQNQGMYTGRSFNPGGFASYNPSSWRYGGSSSFAFPSGNNANAGHLASGSASNNIKVPDGGYRFCDPKELPFGDMRFLSHVPDLVITTSRAPACDGNDALPKEDVAGEERKFYWG